MPQYLCEPAISNEADATWPRCESLLGPRSNSTIAAGRLCGFWQRLAEEGRRYTDGAKRG